MEVFVSYAIFMLLFIVIVFLWSQTIRNIGGSQSLYEFEELATDVSEGLIRAPGIPSDWNETTVEVIGLSSNGSRVLDPLKVLAFVNMMNSSNYENNSDLAGTGKYDFYVRFTDINNTVIEIDGVSCATGKPYVNETKMITEVKTAALNGQLVRMHFTLWAGE